MNEKERQIYANLSRLAVLTCFRNSKLEDIHAGTEPVSRTGDFSDVIVVDADGRRIPWPEVSHFDDEAMRDLMRKSVDRLYTLYVMAEDWEFQQNLERWRSAALAWDAPKLDEDFMGAIVTCRATGNDAGNPNNA